MSIYQEFCTEAFDALGGLKRFELNIKENFNFGYDVVDALAEREPQKKALVWCNAEEEEHTFTFADIKARSNQIANVLNDAGIKKGDRVLVILKRHYEYWFVAVALHKLGATMIPATHMLTVNDYVYRMKATNISGVVCTTQNNVPEKIKAALEEASCPAQLWCVQRDVDGFSNLTTEMQQAPDQFPV